MMPFHKIGAIPFRQGFYFSRMFWSLSVVRANSDHHCCLVSLLVGGLMGKLEAGGRATGNLSPLWITTQRECMVKRLEGSASLANIHCTRNLEQKTHRPPIWSTAPPIWSTARHEPAETCHGWRGWVGGSTKKVNDPKMLTTVKGGRSFSQHFSHRFEISDFRTPCYVIGLVCSFG